MHQLLISNKAGLFGLYHSCEMVAGRDERPHEMAVKMLPGRINWKGIKIDPAILRDRIRECFRQRMGARGDNGDVTVHRSRQSTAHCKTERW